uniref:M48 family peptidase n=1 Tax=Acidobacterium capsulatum TaxID=33075 RepID=A0A7V4XSV1_9BACT
MTFPDPVYTLPPARLAKAIALSHWETFLYFGGTLWSILALWFALRVGPWLRDGAEWITSYEWLQGLMIAPAWVLILTVIGLPFGLLGHWVSLHYGLSVQPWVHGGASWLMDFLKSTGVSLLVGTVVLSGVYFLLRRSPRRWWLWFWIVTLPVEIAVVFLAPVVLDPIFDHFQPLQKADPALVQRLEQLAAHAGQHILPSRMFVMNASARSTGINAYVTGFGASKRIVVWDNTVKDVPPNQILFICGHEMGHYALHHIVKGLLFTFGMLFFGYWLVHLLLNGVIAAFGRRMDIRGPDDWASVGVLLLIVTVLGFLAAPIGNAFSRWEEHQADVYGQEAIHGLVPDPQATAVHAFQRLGEVWLENPHPNPFVTFWTASHPPVEFRATFAAHYNPWAPGKKPMFFSK